MKSTKLIIGLLLLFLLGYNVNAQYKSDLTDENKVHSWNGTHIWKVGDVYYIRIIHPAYGDAVLHNFKIETLQAIKDHSRDVMEHLIQTKSKKRTHIYYSEFDYHTKNKKIVYKVGRQGKKHVTIMMFNDTDWIHQFSKEVRLDELVKWLGVELN
jgi:hypothetical protein